MPSPVMNCKTMGTARCYRCQKDKDMLCAWAAVLTAWKCTAHPYPTREAMARSVGANMLRSLASSMGKRERSSPLS